MKKNYIGGLVVVSFVASGLLGAAMAEGDSIVEANVKELEPGDKVAVSRIPDVICLRSVNDPDDIIWERLQKYRIHTAPAPPVHE
ncbi:MAG: hypothetical protein ACR2RF_17640, partial [Geminicoccaceae bacterium]